MANSCSITVSKLPKVINKMEYFLFRAMEQNNVDFFQIAENPKLHLSTLMSSARDIIDSKVLEYIKKASSASKRGDTELGEMYQSFATNLQNISSNWATSVLNTLVYSKIFGVKTKFKLDDKGMVDLEDVLKKSSPEKYKQIIDDFLKDKSQSKEDKIQFKFDDLGLTSLSELADDEDSIYKKFIVDQSANEIDPLDSIDKAVEIFIRSIPRSKEVYDDYGFTVGVDYPSFVRNLMADLEGTITIEEIIKRLNDNLQRTPEYQHIIDMLTISPTDNSTRIQLKINFRNSFAKAQIPIYMTSVEGDVVKVFEATVAKRSRYEQRVKSNFALRGMPVTVDGEKINLAHQKSGVWTIDESDLQKIKNFLDPNVVPAGQMAERRIQFLKGLGFEFSSQAEDVLKKTITSRKAFDFLYQHLINRLSNPGTKKVTDIITDPLSALRGDWRYLSGERSGGQSNVINDIIELEVKYNPEYNVERSVINSEGNRQHSTQLHNNFTIINRHLSDAETFPTLQSIIDAEPSLQWLNPETNPGIKNSMFLNSLFFMDSKNPETFGKRKRIVRTKSGLYFTTKVGETMTGEKGTDLGYVYITINNTGGLQLKDGSQFKEDGASTTALNEGDKLLQDLNDFMSAGYSSVPRLGDKSTDLGIFLNYYSDPETGRPVKKHPLGTLNSEFYNNVFTSKPFVESLISSLKNYAGMKYLAHKGFYDNLDFASKNAINTWGEFEKILAAFPGTNIGEALNTIIKSEEINSVEEAEFLIEENRDMIALAIKNYFENYHKEYLKKLAPYKSLVGVNTNYLIKAKNFDDITAFYLANSFLIDLETMKIFFGGAIHFKDFHKRASNVSATGIFTFVEPALLEHFNDVTNSQGYGPNTNLAARRLAERLLEQGKITPERFKEITSNLAVTKEIKSAVLQEIKFESKQSEKIIENIERLYKEGKISKQSYDSFNRDIKKLITSKDKGGEGKYSGDEGDGQGKCTFDFYRTMSILTNNWNSDQERVYKKIVEYDHYDQLAEEEMDENKKAEYIKMRDAVGYDPTEQVYFPPKKFQYSGPMKHEKIIDGQMYNALVPMFDKFSLQPLIPTLIRGTEDEELAKRMSFEGVSYVKFKSASKVETPKDLDALYENFDSKNPETRTIKPFDERLKDDSLGFKSEHTIFLTHLKEQVRIDAEAHDDVIFGSQSRKLILMNLLSINTTHNREEFVRLANQYRGLIDDLVQIEKTIIYDKLGIKSENGKPVLKDLEKLARYFRDEINKKNQDSNVRKAIELDEKGNFKIPLDASVQAQIIEGILISSINNNIVRYKASGSMLTQVAITGSAAKKFSKDSSKKALETFGNSELKYYDLATVNGKTVVTAMQVKVGFTKQWQPLLNLTHPDGNKIESLSRLNESLKNEEWMNKHRDSLRMVAYRIPTQGRNFLDVMEVAEFLPAQFGDAVIMPSEIVIKNGGDFDIDKMFVFYPNMRKDGTYHNYDYTQSDLKRLDADTLKPTVQNKLFRTMAEIILHPNNYMELVTPSTNYHIEPLIDKIYDKLGLKERGKPRPKTDYKNTEILEKTKNIEKFLSLLKGKSDLGIAAIANTFNVLFQLSNAEGNTDFFTDKKMDSFFSSKFMSKTDKNRIENIQFGDMYDEDGVLKSEFFSEFINAFVDVAKDDYVFGVNVVTEFSPMIFYMKFAGLSSRKILAFINQPILRRYIQNLSKYENMFMQNYIKKEIRELRSLLPSDNFGGDEIPEIKELRDQLKALESGSRRKALAATLAEFGFDKIKPTRGGLKKALGDSDFSTLFTSQNLFNNIKKVDTKPSDLTQDEKNLQLAVLYEMLGQKEQSDSLTEAQRFLNFDTNPYASAFDAFMRDVNYQTAITESGNNVLSPNTLRKIKNESIISPLDVSSEIKALLDKLLPVRNNPEFNNIILKNVIAARNDFKNKNISSADDMLKYARTAKNDFMNFILQNFFEKSEKGKEFFKENFDTEKGLNEYLKELIETDKLRNELIALRDSPFYPDLVQQFPFLQNITIIPGKNIKTLITYKISENSNNPVDKESLIEQFEEVAMLKDPDMKFLKDFIRNLSLYSIFQSGYNSSDVSYTSSTPVDIINPLYAAAIEEFQKLTPEEKTNAYNTFFSYFNLNNPQFFSERKTSDSVTGESSKSGKWYTKAVNLELGRVPIPVPEVKQKTKNNSTLITMPTPFVNSILQGVKTIHSFPNVMENGVYKLTNPENESINVELKFYKAIDIFSLDTDVKKESFAKMEGFVSWNDLITAIDEGKVKRISKEFLEGTQTLNVYHIKPLEVSAKVQAKPVKIMTQYVGKFIYSTPGSGKTTLSKVADRVVDTDDLMVEEMTRRHPDFKQEVTEKIQDFIFRYVKTHDHKAEINKIVLDRVKQLVAQGNTVLTGTTAFIKDVDFVFRMNPESKQAIERFGSVEKAKEFAQVEKDLVEKAGKTAVETKRMQETLAEQSANKPGTSVKPIIDTSREWKGDLESRPVFTKEGVNTMRTSDANTFENFGNPFSEAGYGGTIKVASIGEAVVAYKEWLLGTNHKDVKPQQRVWILDQINQGKLDGATLLYAGKSEARGQGMHPTALAEVVEQLRTKTLESGKKQAVSTTNPLLVAGVKPTDMYGNAAKDIQMAGESTQFIGFGTIMKEGNVSSTDKYAKAWGNKANTGVYSANDVIMVSGSGNFGRGGVDKVEEAAAIKKTLTEKYKPLLEKAIAAGASFRVGNQYAKGNLSDQLVADYLKKKGYVEQKLDGYSRWSKPTTPSVTTKVKPGLEELFDSTPELANAVYEAAGIGKFRVTLGKELDPEQKFGSQGEPIVKKFEVLDENKKIIGTVTLDIAKKGAITAHPKLTTIGKGYGQELYQIISLTFGAPVIEWGPHNISKSLEGKKLWSSLEKKGLAKAKYQWDDDIYLRGIDLSQQKQQALQLYSQYLDTIFPDSKVKDIVYHGTDKELKKFYDNLRSGIHFGTLKQAEGRRRATDFEFKRNAKFISAIIDLKNPLKTKDFDWEKAGDAFTSWQPGDDLSDLDFTEYLISSGIIKEEEIQDAEGDFDLINKKGYDGVVYKNEGTGETTGENSYAVSKSEQIHILGNKQDIEGFKKFISKDFYEQFSEEIEKSEEESRERFGEYLDKINAFREMMRLDMTDEDIDKMYNKEKLSGETIEEFLHRMSCLGKLK